MTSNNTRVMFLGDTHGNTENLISVIQKAEHLRVDLIIQLGDFGFWPHTAGGLKFLDRISEELVERGVTLWFLDGNHENHDALRTYEDHPTIRPRLVYLPRGTRFELGGLKFLVLGGAGSVDQHFRTEYISWWRDEVISPEDVEACIGGLRAVQEVDVLLSHDATWVDFPTLLDMQNAGFNDRIPPEVDHTCDNSRHKLSYVASVVSPQINIHGHMHTELFTSGGEFRTLGLGYDLSRSGRQWITVHLPGDGTMIANQSIRGGVSVGDDLLTAEDTNNR